MQQNKSEKCGHKDMVVNKASDHFDVSNIIVSSLTNKDLKYEAHRGFKVC
jgi:hypothetical protein